MGERTVVSTNGAGTTGYSHAKEYICLNQLYFNKKLIVVRVAQLCEKLLDCNFKWVNCMVYELYLKKAVIPKLQYINI